MPSDMDRSPDYERMMERDEPQAASVHPIVIWISVTDSFGRSRRVRGDLVQSIESVTIPAGDYFGPEIATFSVLHFAKGCLRVVERSEQIEAMIQSR